MTAPVQLDLVHDQLPDMAAPHNGTRESLLAALAHDEMPKRAKDRQYIAILRTLEYDGGLTDEQIQASTTLDANSERPRRGELERQGLICRTAGGRTKSGRAAARWWLTKDGARLVGELRGWRYYDGDC